MNTKHNFVNKELLVKVEDDPITPNETKKLDELLYGEVLAIGKEVQNYKVGDTILARKDQLRELKHESFPKDYFLIYNETGALCKYQK
jgi:hypothetical protein